MCTLLAHLTAASFLMAGEPHMRTTRWMLLGLLGLSGCSTEQPTVSRVQANALDKAVFQGEWYFLQTVIDTPYSAGYTFVGEQGDLNKIRWEIQERYLIARRSYEFFAGSEPTGISGGSEPSAAIAMYAIESHFDIRREYNPTTGEELNIVVENEIDRRWFERQFMRVDWSQNLITNSDFLVLAKVFDGIRMEPVSYYVQDLNEGHPHRPRFDRNESGDVHYVDIVNKMFVEPQSVSIDGLGDIPSCFLLYQDHFDCAPGEITVRNSFLRVDPSRDYQPMVYTGDRMERFGYFVTERAGWNDQYGLVDPARFRFVNRHNLWQESHRRTPEGTLVACGNDQDCQGSGAGSVCDLDLARANRTFSMAGWLEGACTIPYRERQVRPVAYFASQNLPADLEPDVQHFVSEWNEAFSETIGSLRQLECTSTGGDGATCAAERDRPDGQQAFVMCHNPVVNGDSPACGSLGTAAEIGDLRYHLIGWISEPHRSSPLGYGPSAADPETGEIIQANAFVYGYAVETTAAYARDLVALLNGDLDEDDITNGTQVQAWVNRMNDSGSEMTGRPADDHVIPIDGFNVDRVNEAMSFEWAEALGTQGNAGRPRSMEAFVERMEQAEATLARNGAFGPGVERGAARLQNLIGTDVERLMVTADMRAAAHIDPSLPITNQTLDLASPLRGLSVSNLEALERARNEISRESCILNADFVDDGLVGLARAIQHAVENGDGTMTWYGVPYTLADEQGNLDYDAVRRMIRHPIFDAVTAHEVGHTVGLRHNFSGSFDALNYHPHYWELRDDGRMMPRAWDPMTAAEIDGRIREYQYSTVMDYGSNFIVTDSEGIGHYDTAAIKMGYGDLVEVFAGPITLANRQAINAIKIISGFGYPVVPTLDALQGGDMAAYVYTDWPDLVGSIGAMEQRADVRYADLTNDSTLPWDDLVQDTSNRPTVPYLFCSDEQADLNPDCLRYDAGADAYESLQSIIDTYWNYYIFNAYRRGRIGFETGAYNQRVLTRYFAKLRNSNQIYALFRGIFAEQGTPPNDPFWTRPDGMGAWTAGVGAGYNLFTQVLATPEPGGYGNRRRGDGSAALTPGGMDVTIDGFDGRPIETTWDFDAGYFWFDQLDRAGFFYDKILAVQVLADPETHFVDRDTAADIRRYQLSYHTTFGNSVTSVFRGVVGEDWGTYAPRASGTSLVYPDPLQLTNQDMAGIPIDPSVSFSVQLYAAVYGMAWFPDTFDQSFFNSARIFVRGGAEGVTLDPSIPTVEYTDPRSGFTYVAISIEDAGGNETGVGAQMLLHAADLSRAGAAVELSRFVDNLNIIRELSWRFGLGI